MAATYDYNVTAADVAAEIPGVDDANIGANTEPLSTTDLTQWINEGAAKMNAVLDKSSISASDDLDDDAQEALVAAVKGYAVFRAVSVLGITGPVLDAARDAWNTAYSEYSNRPQQLGDAYTEGYTVNIDSDDKSESWSFIDSEGSIW